MKNMNIKQLWTPESVLKLNCAVKRSGLKIWQIEKLSGTTQDTIYRTLHGQTVPYLKSLEGIAKAVKVDVGYLLDDNKWTIPDSLQLAEKIFEDEKGVYQIVITLIRGKDGPRRLTFHIRPEDYSPKPFLTAEEE